MRVLLCDPPHHHLRPDGAAVQVHPLALGALAAALAPEHEVWQLVPDVATCASAEDPWARIRDTVAALRPDVVGITSLTASFPAALALARLVRALLPEARIVMGGVHSTFRPAEALAEPAVDAVVVGEGEDTLLELLRAWAAGQDPAGTPGLVVRREGGLYRGPPRPPRADLDTLPAPRREGVLWSENLRPGFYQAVITVRGCPYTCTYCSVPQSDDRKTRYRSAAHVAAEIATLRARYDIPYLYFHDSVFTLHRKRTQALCTEMILRDLVVPFTCQTRADRVDPTLLDGMAAAGCKQIFFGIESGHPETLRRIHKAMPLDQIRDAVRWAKERGIRAAGFFMVGFPWETNEHIEATTDFATHLDLDAISLFSATPLPGTALWDEVALDMVPASIDFRAPEINLTALPDYPERFRRARAAFDTYNQSGMLARVASHWPRG